MRTVAGLLAACVTFARAFAKAWRRWIRVRWEHEREVELTELCRCEHCMQSSPREAEPGDLKAAYIARISANCYAYGEDRLTAPACTCCGLGFRLIIISCRSRPLGL
jgi:hypothetical protein